MLKMTLKTKLQLKPGILHLRTNEFLVWLKLKYYPEKSHPFFEKNANSGQIGVETNLQHPLQKPSKLGYNKTVKDISIDDGAICA
ncbi:MAG: hypothetical protein IKT62_05695 [Firmicutes bacterium]|nr:hypothetical protein [Bacillota bacterium]